uniref:Fibrinogen C-terminal domain-containing protein n=1 Tax=Amphimedon queenslandica TaxID=400682 RepID=A0A1X7UVK4_AMPQE
MEGKVILLLLLLSSVALSFVNSARSQPPLCKKWQELYEEHCNQESSVSHGEPTTTQPSDRGRSLASAATETRPVATRAALREARSAVAERDPNRRGSSNPVRSSPSNITYTNNTSINTTTGGTNNGSSNSTNNSKENPNPNPYFEKSWLSCCEVASHARLLSTEKAENKEEKKHEITSGVYKIKSGPFAQTMAYCNIDNNKEGWTVILRRYNGQLVFNRSWEEYEFGFGSLDEEFWYGLSRISSLTNNGSWELQIELETHQNKSLIAKYDHFLVKGPNEQYNLILSGYRGEVNGDFLKGWAGRPFTTIDKDNNDPTGATSCADIAKSGWWYTNTCYADRGLNLNKAYEKDGIKWEKDSYETIYIKRLVAKMRQKGCLQNER